MSASVPNPPPPGCVESLRVDFQSFPVAALRMEGGRVAAVNAAYTELTSIGADEIVGREASELISSFVLADDAPFMQEATAEVQQGAAQPGEVWCRVTDRTGVERVVRVLWRPVLDRAEGAVDQHVVFLIPADVDARERELAERLTCTASTLLRCTDEGAVLERAAEALAATGCIVTFLLLRDDESLLDYGPTRVPEGPVITPEFASIPLPREILTRLNPRFHERRAAFHQRPDHLVGQAYPAPLAAQLAPLLRDMRTVQAPLFVSDQPYGAMVVTSKRLTHVSVGTLEMYAQLVAAAVENVRLHERARSRLDQMRRLQSDLVRSERLAALGEAAAIMAHEVRNPIGAILNAVVLLDRGTVATGVSDAELRRMIVEEASRLERIVSDLLTLGRPLAPRVRATSLAEVATRAAAVLAGRDELHGCVIDRVEGDAPRAAADPDLAELALLNVLRNAVQASPCGGHVRVITRDAGDAGVAAVVEDTGPGFSDEATQRMFEPFFTTRATGTGIGLAVVRRILDAHQGSLTVERGSRGGARVTLRFPAWRGE